jgi:hypothetical protein
MSSTPHSQSTGDKGASLSPMLANLKAKDLSSAVQALAEAKAKRCADSEALKKAILSRTGPSSTNPGAPESRYQMEPKSSIFQETRHQLLNDNIAGSPWGPEDAEFIKKAVEEELSNAQDTVPFRLDQSSVAASFTQNSEVRILTLLSPHTSVRICTKMMNKLPSNCICTRTCPYMGLAVHILAWMTSHTCASTTKCRHVSQFCPFPLSF